MIDKWTDFLEQTALTPFTPTGTHSVIKAECENVIIQLNQEMAW